MTTYWVQIDYHMGKSTTPINGSPVTFLGESVWDLHDKGVVFSFEQAINPSPFYTWPWFLSSLPYAHANKGHWDNSGYHFSDPIYWNYTIAITDYFISGDRTDPTIRTGPTLTDSEHDDLGNYDVVVNWTDWAWARVFIPNVLFTTTKDVVNFNALYDHQTNAINDGADIYRALAGDDVVRLPDISSYTLSPLVGWDNTQVFYANDGHDSITGGNGPDKIDGELGSDTIRGSAGDDTLDGGENDDWLWGDSGADSVIGGAGNDTLVGGTESDSLRGGSDADWLFGDLNATGVPLLSGNDSLDGEGGNDTMLGGEGNDTLYGGQGLDFLYGDNGDDFLGAADNDASDVGPDVLAGGTGRDEFWVDDGDTIANLETSDLRAIFYTNFTIDRALALFDQGKTIVRAFDSRLDQSFSDAVTIAEGFSTQFLNIENFSGLGNGLILTRSVAPPLGKIEQMLISDVAAARQSISEALVEPAFVGLVNDLKSYGNEWAVKRYFAQNPPANLDGALGQFAKKIGLAKIGGAALALGELIGNEISGKYNNPSESRVEDWAIAILGLVNPAAGITVKVGIAIFQELKSLFIQGFQIWASGLLNFMMNFGDSNDTIQGGDSSEYFYPRGGNDAVRAGGGNDVVVGGTGAGEDYYDGEGGADSLFYTSATNPIAVDLAAGTASGLDIDRDTLRNFEEVYGGQGADGLRGDQFSNLLDGHNGMDVVSGLGGNDTLIGGIGADTLIGGMGSDTFYIDDSSDIVTELAGEGTDRVFSSVSKALFANVENMILEGTSNINGSGNDLNNSLVGNAGANVLDGRAGADRMFGHAGNDTYIVDNIGDAVAEASGNGTDTVKSTITYALGTNVEKLLLLGATDINGTGNDLSNVLVGNNGINRLDGAGGVDNLTGANGLDYLAGGVGNDRFIFNDVGESGPSSATRDRILDFTAGDTIWLSSIDANALVDGNQAFLLDTDGSFSAGEIRQTVFGSNLLLEMNTNATVAAEMSILLLNRNAPLTAGDIVL